MTLFDLSVGCSKKRALSPIIRSSSMSGSRSRTRPPRRGCLYSRYMYIRTARAWQSVLIEGRILFGSVRSRCCVLMTSGAMKSLVPMTSGLNFPVTTRPSRSMMDMPLPGGSRSTFLYERSECARPAALRRFTACDIR